MYWVNFSQLKELKEYHRIISRARNGSNGPVAQWIEHLPSKQGVVGSTPTRASSYYFVVLTVS